MRVLVVGLGNIARRHIRNLKALDPSIEVVVWRQRPDPPDWEPPQGLPVERYLYNIAGAFPFDAAIVANPASMHRDTAMSLAADGCHLFVEKPLADRTENTRTLVWACQKFGRVLMVGYDLRFYRPLQLVKESIDSGRIGRPLHIRCEVGQYLPDWRPGRDYRTSVSARRDLGGGVLLELSHEIDYARWLMGEVESVTAQVGRLSDLEIDVEDTADILLRFKSGAQGSIHLDMMDRHAVRRCRVVGTDGSIDLDLLGWEAWLCKGDGRQHLHWRAGPREDPHLAEMRCFLACCRGETVPPVDGQDGWRVLEIVCAARKSAEEGREVRI